LVLKGEPVILRPGKSCDRYWPILPFPKAVIVGEQTTHSRSLSRYKADVQRLS